jgi:peptide/nickel transport system permease protein
VTLRVLRKIFHFAAVLFLVTFATTALVELMPGSPAMAILGENASPAAIEAFNAQYGYDQPLLVRYFGWVSDAITGNLGTSMRQSVPVTEIIQERMPVTLELSVLAILIAVSVAVPAALIAADRAGGAFDRVVGAIASALVSVPAFVMALLLVSVFSIRLGLTPIAGWVPLSEGLAENLRYAILPAMTLALVEIPVILRVLRSDAISTLGQEYVLAARARGMSRRYVMTRHVLRPSSFSLVTLVGLMIGRLLGGTVIVEMIFALPGLGTAVIQAITAKDIIVVQGIVVVIAVIYVALNALVDLAYVALDPRVRRA